jgi:hypothetical protein
MVVNTLPHKSSNSIAAVTIITCFSQQDVYHQTDVETLNTNVRQLSVASM